MHGPEVQYLDRNSDLLPPDPRRSIDQELDVDGEIQLITSPSSLRRVVVDLKLDDRPKFQRGAGTGILSSLRGLFGGDPDSASSTEIAAGTLQRHLKAERLGRSAVISIGYTAGDPRLVGRNCQCYSPQYRRRRRLPLPVDHDRTSGI
jgi:uncharacterized protein involved in exopolysaccharide biosynthesis